MLKRRYFKFLPFGRALFALVLAGALLTPPAAVSAATPSQATEQDLERFIQGLAGDSFQIISDTSVARSERIVQFRGLLKNSFALDSIGKWVLGRYWRRASNAEKTEYLRLFEDMIIATYVDRFGATAGEHLSITRSISHGGGKFTVFSKFIRPGGTSPTSVDWRLGRKDGRFLIVDVIVQGISMSTTLRSEYASTIRRSGSGVTGLLEMMRAKTATLRLSAEK